MRPKRGVVYALAGMALLFSLATAGSNTSWPATALYREPGVNMPLTPPADDATGVPQPATDGNWVSFPAPTTNPNRICAGSVCDYINNKIYMAGGTIDGQAGAELNTFQRFDPVTNTWTDMASMPAGRTWLDGQGSFVARQGKIYIIGGMTGSGTGNTNCWQYDIATNTWATRASMPTGQLAYASGIWRDSLIYILGGYNANTLVQIYDAFNNVWLSGTALPEGGDMGSSTIIGDTIYITNFYNRSSNQLWTNGRKGYINPSNPTQITWSSWTRIHPPDFDGGTAQMGGKVYHIGGFSTLYVGSDHLRGWVYDPRTGVSESLPWLPMPPYRRGLARCNFMVGNDFTNELFVTGGDEYGDWSQPNNYYYRNQFIPPHDITCWQMLTPTGAVDSGQALVPTLVCRNSGAFTENYKAFMVLPGGYLDSVEMTGIPRGQTDTITFPVWIPTGRDSASALGYTTCDMDSFYGDDTVRSRFLIRVKDVAVTGIVTPKDTMDSGLVVTPQAWVWNYGNQSASFPLTFRIGSWVTTANVVNLIPGGQTLVSFPDAYTTMPGIYAITVNAVVAGDLHPANNVAYETLYVEGNIARDVAVISIDEPVGAVDTTMTVSPKGTVRNNGSDAATFWTYFNFYDPTGALVYSESLNTMLGAGGQLQLQFPDIKFGEPFGRYTAVCSTYFDGDQNSMNDLVRQGFYVFAKLAGDIGVTRILQPDALVDTGEVVTPQAEWKNYSATEVTTFAAYALLTSPSLGRCYTEESLVTLTPGATIAITFEGFNVGADTGVWVCRCSTFAAGDTIAANDWLDKRFTVATAPPWRPGWVEVQSVPAGAKAVKDGAFLTRDERDSRIYAARGNKTGDFFVYDAMGDTDGVWTSLTTWPMGGEGKLPYKGANGVSDNRGGVYATKGNNTQGFWKYSIDSTAWRQLANVPLGASLKKVKGGTDLVYVMEGDTGWVYLLKGYKQDFFRFNTALGTWDTTLPLAPAGARPKWDKGSWLVYDGENTLYAHKAKYQELWTFDLATHTWATAARPGMPLVGMMGKKKKSKDGGAAAWYDGSIYALKGGNTQEWWKYAADSAGAWTELETIPAFGSTAKKKRVKAGGDVVSYGNGYFFAFKGNKTLEFWRYGLAPTVGRPAQYAGTQTDLSRRLSSVMRIGPSPLVGGWAELSYNLPQAGPVRVTVYDITGRSVVATNFVAGHSGSARLDLRKLSAGVYLVKLQAQGVTRSQKLVVQ